MAITKERIEEIIREMNMHFGSSVGSTTTGVRSSSISSQPRGQLGIFSDVEDAIAAAKASQIELIALGLEKRRKIVEAMRKAAIDNAEHLAIMAVEETGFGKVEHKIAKNLLAAEKTPGIEDLVSTTYTGDDGLTLIEGAPFGVIGAITPSTNPAATIINNGISMVAAGNSVVFNPHPGAKEVTNEAIRILNKAIMSAGGPSNVLCSTENPTIESSNTIMKHKDIAILVVTGGEGVVRAAMNSGKKVIAAGPGNPPVIVDDTADIKKAAKDIVDGASFDNNILCIAEKEVFVFRNVADRLIEEMIKNGAYLANKSTGEIEKIKNTVFETKGGKTVLNKKFVGKSANYILSKSNIDVNGEYKLIIAEVDATHPFVLTEMLMPVLPIVRVDSIDEAIQKALDAEQANRHTALMHSQNVTNLTKAARALNTTIFVKNAPSYAGLGYQGEGYTTLTIATPTGEGLTSARTFTRQRRCTLYGSFRII
ncbi:MAG TPA: aldehyde dehydrogenase EutE [Clostridiales bacterium]|nr:aldehyde dehydrogenase EutE [Clostridiales bacterium]